MSQPKRLHYTDTSRLKPFVDAIEELLRPLKFEEVAELERLERACDNSSETNCSWDTYRAAQIIGPAVKHELRIRRHHRVDREARE